MNRIQKAATAFIALTITVVGAILVTAPLSLADSHWTMSYADSHVSPVAAHPTATLRARRAATDGTSA
jgi:hypothetical protein